MSSQISIIPDVEGEFLVIDYSLPPEARTYRRPVRIIKPELITFNIPTSLSGIRVGLKEALRELIETNVEIGIAEDINKITGEYEHSPPIKIHPSERNRLRIVLGGNRAVFQIVRLNNRSLAGGFGQERVFKTAPPELYYDKTSYYEPDRKSLLFMPTGEEATCAYQYIYQTFGKINGFKKLTDHYNTIKYWSQKEPPQYQSWLRQYARETNIEMLDLNIQQAVDKEVKSFETELFKVNITDIEEQEKWNDDEIDKSMSVLDIIRWCMWARINCYVIDFDGHYYMSYNHKTATAGHPDRKLRTARYSIVVKVRDNHAYFVKDPDLKKSACHRYETWKHQEFEEVGHAGARDDEFELVDKDKINTTEYWIHPYHKIKHDAEGYGIMDAMKEQGLEPFEIGWDKAYEILGKSNKNLYKKYPPPTPQEIMDDSGKTFYLGTDKLNGIVSHLYHNYNVLPEIMNGTTGHKIDRASYGSNKILGRSTLPMYSENLPDQEFIDSVKKLLPNLDYSRLPTIRAVADEIFKELDTEQSLWSMFNSNTRRAFFDSEIKPENQVYKAEVEKDSVWSVDISKAYTTALLDYDLEWNVYDAVCQFEKYKGDFNPNYFYLVKEIGTGFPLRNQKDGLVLYHGCLLRHLLGKGLVIIKQVIKPIRTLHSKYFVDFVEKCKKVSLKSNNNISYKRLINTWVGGIKRPDKLNHYKCFTTPSETSITRAFYQGSIVSMLDKNTEFNDNYRYEPSDKEPLFLISKPNNEFNITTGQPIRLAVIDKVNEMLYQLYCAMRAGLYFYNRLNKSNEKLELCLTKTDALYFEENTFNCNKFLDVVGDTLDFEIRKEHSIDKKDWVFREYKPQNQVLYKQNKWKNKIPINHYWDKDTGAKKIFKLINTLGGCWIEGEGGVGKTEFIKTFSNVIGRNRIRYKWLRYILKSQEDPRYFEKLEEWRNDNPAFAIKLAPTNKACNNIGGKTLHKGLGIPVLNVDVEDKTPAYFDRICSTLAGNGYSKPATDYVVVDEISFLDGFDWSILYSLKRRIPRLKFILSGDIKRQLPPISESWRFFEGAYVIKELANFNKIEFNYNFRTGLSGNILWDDWSLHPERFKVDNDAPITLLNICWTNKKRKEIINQLEDKIKTCVPHKILTKTYDDDVWCGMFEEEEDYTQGGKNDGHRKEIVISVGCPLIAIKSIKEYGISKNEFRRVVTFDDDLIELDDGCSYEYDFIYHNFLSAYCITTHKAQGDTYKQRYTIHEWDRYSEAKKFNRRLRYVAQSRSTDPENNIVYKNRRSNQ
tara:strand:+ start:1320 stop:5159 length:3840 start_codon:yes stop_codon:yes gene_type:complete